MATLQDDLRDLHEAGAELRRSLLSVIEPGLERLVGWLQRILKRGADG